jgi:diguanylate cyclase (GGDEF)-like protein/PAS domain S-box-containing protein
MFEAVDNAIFILAASTFKIIDVNPCAASTLRYSRKELLSKRLTELVGRMDRQEVDSKIRFASSGGLDGRRFPITYRRKDGSEYCSNTSFRRAGSLEHELLVAVCHGASEATATSPSAERIDPVTGLPDRTHLLRRLTAAIDRARNEHQRCAVIFVDIDRFKDINDLWGHVTGDRVLAAVAEHLVSCARPSDYVMRYGGDEFVLILEKIRARRDALKIAARLRKQLKFDLQPLIYRRNPEHSADSDLQNPYMITASVGLAVYTNDLHWPEDLVDRADRNMYRRKAKTSRREGA